MSVHAMPAPQSHQAYLHASEQAFPSHLLQLQVAGRPDAEQVQGCSETFLVKLASI